MTDYPPDLEDAAKRHYEDARKLEDARRLDNAGYHFGLATECAVKELLVRAGVSTTERGMWDHFPALRDTAIQAVAGARRASKLPGLLDGACMNGWDVKMRYSKNGRVEPDKLAKWKAKALDALQALV